MNIRRILLAAGLMFAPLAAIGVAEGISPIAAFATGCGGQTSAELGVGILGNLYTQTLFADSAHTWYPAQNTSNAVTGNYATWDICWTVSGGGGGSPYYGTVCFKNEGTGEWLGNNTTEFNEQTATAGGCGPSETYTFHCEDENLQNYQTGHFLMYNDSLNDPVQIVSVYHGIGNVEVAEAGFGYDNFYNQGTHFCH